MVALCSCEHEHEHDVDERDGEMQRRVVAVVVHNSSFDNESDDAGAGAGVDSVDDNSYCRGEQKTEYGGTGHEDCWSAVHGYYYSWTVVHLELYSSPGDSFHHFHPPSQ